MVTMLVVCGSRKDGNLMFAVCFLGLCWRDGGVGISLL